jgi:hypothetical protein
MKREREIMKNTEFVTSLRVTDVDVHNESLGDESTHVRGHFGFDGRIRSDQTGRFVTHIVPGELTTHLETNFTVKVVKAKHVQWREMKSCPQKARIQSELTARVMEHLKGEQNENDLENTSETGPIVPTVYPEEFDVETERALALEEAANTVPSDLNAVVAAAAVEDSNDLLEIPNFLKRS